MSATFDADEARSALHVLLQPGQVTEMRAVGAVVSGNHRAILAGYYDNVEALIRDASTIDAKGIYFIPNVVNPLLLSRCANSFERARRGSLTTDIQIIRRRWLLVDVDPIRAGDPTITGISSTAAELQSALQRRDDIAEYVVGKGWPKPIRGISGNGGHLMWAIDEPADLNNDLIERVTRRLAELFTDDIVAIDSTVFNPSRVWKLPGSVARKGTSSKDRPHRTARLDAVPDIEIVPTAYLDGFAAPFDMRKAYKMHEKDNFDVAAWIARLGLDVDGPHVWNGTGRKWIFKTCPCQRNETDGGTAILQQPTGALVATCHHATCSIGSWADLRALVDPAWDKALREKQVQAAPPEPPPEKDDAYKPEDDDFQNSDLGNADRFTLQHGENVRYCYQNKTWLVWNGRVWHFDDSGEIYRLAEETKLALWARIQFLPSAEDRKHAAAHAIRSESLTRFRAMVEAAQHKPGLQISLDDLDNEPMLLPCPNGIIDLEQGTLRPHDKNMFITQEIDIPYNPEAKCSRWMSFLRRIMDDDDEMITFLQTAIGYTLTGDVSEEVLFFMHGAQGRNGKSTFVETLSYLLGPYYKKAPANMLKAARRDARGGATEDVARLRGARMVVASELNAGMRLDEALVKDLTGGDTLTARYLHQNSFQFSPRFKYWIYGNHEPMIHGTDDAIWRRVLKVNFKIQIPKDEVDPNLKGRRGILAGELPGILAWAVRGARRWRSSGLRPPGAVQRATHAMRVSMDIIGAFIESELVLKVRGDTKYSDVYAAYTAWCNRNGHPPLSSRRFNANLSERGFHGDRGAGGWYVWHGVGLRSHRQEQPGGDAK